MKNLYIILLAVILSFLTACEGFFGKKTPTDFLDEPVYNDQTVAYVPIQPVLDNFNYPVDMIAGWDELIYVADQGTEEIVSLDQAGNELGRFHIPGLGSIAQDRRLDILAAGTIDTVINGTNFTLPAIYRLDLQKDGDYGLANARIRNTIIHPFFFKAGTPVKDDEEVRFEGIAPLANNRFYISRTGPSNSTLKFGGPDNAVLLFNAQDGFETPVFISSQGRLFRDYFKQPKGIVSVAQPPQNPAVDRRGDFVFASTGESVLKVQTIRFVETDFGASYEVQNYEVGDTSRSDRFLYEPNRFEEPVDVTVAGDETNYIFVVDAKKDSVFQFNALGFEGVNPPAGARTKKVIRASFGGTGDGLTQFREPRGIAYINKILFVADSGNGRILRFKLTTDFE